VSKNNHQQKNQNLIFWYVFESDRLKDFRFDIKIILVAGEYSKTKVGYFES